MYRPYDHRAKEFITENYRRECLICGRPVTGAGPTLRHADEAVRPAVIPAKDAAVVAAAAEIIEQALAAMVTDRCTDTDRGRVAAEALYYAGALTGGRGRRRVPV